jgi:hypothetical protein
METRRFPLVDRSNEASGQQSASPFNLSDTNCRIGFHLAEHLRPTRAEAPAVAAHKGRGFCPYSRWREVMSRVGLSVVAGAVAGFSLTGCSSALSSNSSSEQLQALKFESDPPGAEIRTTQGRTCTTPCELSVQTLEQSVTITKNDYVTQTFHVTLGSQPDHSFWENPPPTLLPNPVRVVLQPVPKQAARHSNKTQK